MVILISGAFGTDLLSSSTVLGCFSETFYMTHHHVELCGPKKSNLSSGAKSAAGPFVPEVITSQIIFGKYTFPNVTELGRRESFVGERDNGRGYFHF